jgi:glycosyltransferase involved in cell wall biosynthesis
MSVHRPHVLVTDAWHPQVNGVVQTWTYVQREIERMGHAFRVIHPGGSRGIPAPGEPDLILSTEPRRHVRRALAGMIPAALHIATEGPLGHAARAIALREGWPFTTSYHTRFPEYLNARFRVPERWTYALLRRFHAPARAILVPTESMQRELLQHRFTNTRVWARGVDATRFAPGRRDALDLPRPVWLCAGRVAPEKNLDAFLSLDLPGSKVVVGDGPDAPRLQAAYPGVHWLGRRPHDELARYYDAADVFVFPSRTDTFGLVMLEAMACGCPVAAFPVTGPVDVVTQGVTGFLEHDLQAACRAALTLDRGQVRARAAQRTWRAIADRLLMLLAPIPADAGRGSPGAAMTVAGIN